MGGMNNIVFFRIPLAFNVSLTLSLVYPHSIKYAKVLGGLDVHLVDEIFIDANMDVKESC